jgi:hypothetical protein
MASGYGGEGEVAAGAFRYSHRARVQELEGQVKLLTAGAPAEAEPTPPQAAQRRP